MIVDNIKNIDSYNFANQNLVRAFQYLQSINFDNLSDGRIQIDGQDLYAIVLEYLPKLEDDVYWESHKEYIDIQYILKGEERIGYAKIGKFEVVEPYNSDADVVLGTANGSYISMNLGDFMVLFPQEIHRPGIISTKDSTVKKVIVKVKI
jgi:biofilm protein TabA